MSGWIRPRTAGWAEWSFQSYRDLARLLQRDGRTITAEAVEYPAVAVPADGDLLGWGGFMSSVDAGAAALGAQYASFAQRCPATKVVLAGYSQGAMVVHRNLQALADSPNVAAALLIADGDRLPDDNVISMGVRHRGARQGTGCRAGLAHPGACSGEAAVWPSAARTISVCDLGDAVCDYDADAEEVYACRGRHPYQLRPQHQRGV